MPFNIKVSFPNHTKLYISTYTRTIIPIKKPDNHSSSPLRDRSKLIAALSTAKDLRERVGAPLAIALQVLALLIGVLVPVPSSYDPLGANVHARQLKSCNRTRRTRNVI